MGETNNNYNSQLDNAYNTKPSAAPLVLGILSVVFSLLIALIGLILGIVGLVLSINDKKKPFSKFGTAGTVLSIIGIIISIGNGILGVIIFMGALN